MPAHWDPYSLLTSESAAPPGMLRPSLDKWLPWQSCTHWWSSRSCRWTCCSSHRRFFWEVTSRKRNLCGDFKGKSSGWQTALTLDGSTGRLFDHSHGSSTTHSILNQALSLVLVLGSKILFWRRRKPLVACHVPKIIPVSLPVFGHIQLRAPVTSIINDPNCPTYSVFVPNPMGGMGVTIQNHKLFNFSFSEEFFFRPCVIEVESF